MPEQRNFHLLLLFYSRAANQGIKERDIIYSPQPFTDQSFEMGKKTVMRSKGACPLTAKVVRVRSAVGFRYRNLGSFWVAEASGHGSMQALLFTG